MAIYFISDLHLEPKQEAITHGFLNFLEQLNDADALYILGDFFEVWIGDDFHNPYVETINTALKNLSSKGIELYFLHGNRDFLIGEAWANSVGATLLPEQHVIQLGDDRVLLAHGDEYCTDDVEYMKARQLLRSSAFQQDFLSKSIPERIEFAKSVRAESKSSQQEKSYDIMDVHQDAINTAMNNFNVDIMIHGHTHRPHVHEWQLEKQTRKRFVLGDWSETEGWKIRWDKETGIQLASFSFS